MTQMLKELANMTAGLAEQTADEFRFIGNFDEAIRHYEHAANVALGHGRAARCAKAAEECLRLKMVNMNDD